MHHPIRKTLQNIAIVVLFATSLGSALEPLLQVLPAFRRMGIRPYPTIMNPYGINVDMHRVLAFALGLISVLLVYRLYQRTRLAWVAQMMLLSGLLLLNLLHLQPVLIPVMVAEAFSLSVLGLTHADFSRSPDRPSLRRALPMALGIVAVVLLNAVLSVFVFKAHFAGVHTFVDAIGRTLHFLALMDASYSGYTSLAGLVYANSLIVVTWVFLLAAVLLVMKPLVYDPLSGMYDRHRAYGLVRRFGQNPMAYLALEEDKRYLFGQGVDGVAAYTVIGGVLVCCGDMICHPDDAPAFLAEIAEFARRNAWAVLFVAVTDAMQDVYCQQGFGVAKLGEDACFELASYNLRGNQVAKVRAAVNRADKDGLTVEEYQPTQHRDLRLEHEMREVSRAWFEGKRSQFGFMVGTDGLDNPLGRRYFTARQKGGAMVGFVVFVPYTSNGQLCYMADITRRVPGGPQGVMEKIVIEAFNQMRAEGIAWGNLGLCPLVNLQAAEEATPLNRVLRFVYENLGGVFDFKALHHAKKKFAPSQWQPRYLAYWPKPFTPRLAYALVGAQSASGIRSLLGWGRRRRQAADQPTI